MKRTTCANATVGNRFTDGDQGLGIQATAICAESLNQLQEEVANAIEGLGVTLNGAQENQLLNALLAYFRNASNLNNGTLPALRFNDTSHGNRAGGALHAQANGSTAGFMSSGHYNKLQGIEAGARPDVPAGATAFFKGPTAPTGWTQDVTLNDRVLRLVSGVGGGTGGSWTISGITIGNTTLTVAQMPSHRHSVSGSVANGSTFIDIATDTQNRTSYTNYEGGGQAHTHTPSHDGGWRPAYVDVMACVRQ